MLNRSKAFLEKLKAFLWQHLLAICLFLILVPGILGPQMFFLYRITQNESRLEQEQHEIAATQRKLEIVQEKQTRRQHNSCRVSRERADADEYVGNVDADTQYMLAKFLAPNSMTLRKAFRFEAAAHAHRALIAKKLEGDLGC